MKNIRATLVIVLTVVNLASISCSTGAKSTPGLAHEWWVFSTGGFGGNWPSNPKSLDALLARSSVLRFKPNGEFVSQGFFGSGTWAKGPDRKFILCVEPYTAGARAINLGNKAIGDKAMPIELEAVNETLRLYVTPDKFGKVQWLEFVPYKPTANEINNGYPSESGSSVVFEKPTPTQKKFLGAIERGDSRLVMQMLKSGSDPTGPKKAIVQYMGYDTTTLIMAVSFGHTEVAKILLQSGVDPDESQMGGLTPLMIASRAGFTEIVKLLLVHHANPQLKSGFGTTALDQARKANRKDIEKLILDYDRQAKS